MSETKKPVKKLSEQEKVRRQKMQDLKDMGVDPLAVHSTEPINLLRSRKNTPIKPRKNCRNCRSL